MKSLKIQSNWKLFCEELTLSKIKDRLLSTDYGLFKHLTDMRDSMKPCQHTLSDDVLYKEVVIIGNGPSGIITSFMLSGYVPYLKEVPEFLPIDEMLRTRLNHIPAGQSLYETDLMELADGLEGRSQNPIPLLVDNLQNPCADLGIQEDPLIEWKYDIDKQIDHVVLGRGPPGGSWHGFEPSVLTLSPGAWLALPPHSAVPGCARSERVPAKHVANYYRRYVRMMGLQRYCRSGVVVTSVVPAPRPNGQPCASILCPFRAQWCVSGYDKCERRPFRYLCSRVVLANGAADRPNTLDPAISRHALHSLARIDRAATALAQYCNNDRNVDVVVVGSGLSAADAVVWCLRSGLRVHHVHRAAADALARLSPDVYPDYHQVYKMMQSGQKNEYNNYISYPEHDIVETVTMETENPPKLEDLVLDIEDEALTLKKVKFLNLVTNEVIEIRAYLIAVLIGSKPDLHFLPGNFDLNFENCIECNKMEESKCSLKNHWYYFKLMMGRIQSCKSRFDSEINGNTDEKCSVLACKPNTCKIKDKCACECFNSPYSSGIGFGVDAKKPVDSRSNPISVDKSTHEVINAPKGLYALGPLTADNFVRFICGGALAIVSHVHKEHKELSDS